MTNAEVKSWLEILIKDYIYEDVEDELIEMRDIIYNALDTQALEQTSEDCISRQDAIKEFQPYRKYSSNRTNNEWVDRIEGVLKLLPPVTPQAETITEFADRCRECGAKFGKMNKWIPVSKRLPGEVGTYMTTVDYGKYGLAAGQRYYLGKSLGWEDDCVIAWQPLPTPYKAEGSDEE